MRTEKKHIRLSAQKIVNASNEFGMKQKQWRICFIYSTQWRNGYFGSAELIQLKRFCFYSKPTIIRKWLKSLALLVGAVHCVTLFIAPKCHMKIASRRDRERSNIKLLTESTQWDGIRNQLDVNGSEPLVLDCVCCWLPHFYFLTLANSIHIDMIVVVVDAFEFVSFGPQSFRLVPNCFSCHDIFSANIWHA